MGKGGSLIYWVPLFWNAATGLPDSMNRILGGSFLLCLLLLAGCSSPEGRHETIPCAIGTDAAWSSDCPVERNRDMLTIRHADGGFRRFLIVRDGNGLVAADGAEQASILITGKDEIELSIGHDRYRLPARFAEGTR